MVPMGILTSSVVAGRLKIPPVYIIAAAGVMQIMGFALLSTLVDIEKVMAAQYGYQVLAGLGAGSSTCMVLILTPFSTELRDQGTFQ